VLQTLKSFNLQIMTQATKKRTDTLAWQCQTPCSAHKSADTSGTQMGTLSIHPYSTNSSNLSPSGFHLFILFTDRTPWWQTFFWWCRGRTWCKNKVNGTNNCSTTNNAAGICINTTSLTNTMRYKRIQVSTYSEVICENVVNSPAALLYSLETSGLLLCSKLRE